MKNPKGFTVTSLKRMLLPREDFYGCWKFGDLTLLAAADGITRDLLTGDAAAGTNSDFWHKLRTLALYPRPSPANYASKAFLASMLIYLEPFGSFKVSEADLRFCFYDANYNIGKVRKYLYGDEADINFLYRDYPGCVGSVAAVQENMLYHGFIADSGVFVADKKGKFKFKTPNEGPNSKGSIDEDIMRRYGWTFQNKEGRRIIRREYRNNPEEDLAYGALTGQDEAMEYVRTGSLELEKGDFVACFTDGLEKIIFAERDGRTEISDDFANLIAARSFREIRRLCGRKVSSEGTLAYYFVQ